MWRTIGALLRSRKFIVGLSAAITDALVLLLGMDETVAITLVTAITTIAGVIIVAIAVEDAAEKLHGDD